MPTFAPGCHFVPRWRTIMLPATTRSPPNFFTPRRLDSESRPLRDDPPAFLCAIRLLLCAYRGASLIYERSRARMQFRLVGPEPSLIAPGPWPAHASP